MLLLLLLLLLLLQRVLLVMVGWLTPTWRPLPNSHS
jgi:hypothetical protein